MSGVEGYSEYDGNGVMPNTVFPKGEEALTAGDKLRLQSITGQETDSRAPVDPAFWHGATLQDPAEEARIARLHRQAGAQRRRAALDQYKPTPRQY